MADLQRVLMMFDNVKKGSSPDDFFVSCPLHTDKTPSLHITQKGDGTILFRCMSCEGGLKDLQEIRPDLTMDLVSNGLDWPKPKHQVTYPAPEPDEHGVSLVSMARYTKLPTETLQSYGLREEGMQVEVPCFDEQMQILNRKFRVALRGKGKYRYEKGGKILLYGLWRKRAKRMVFVEGESDCWTLWHHGIPALGVPGASMVGKIRPRDTQGIESAWVIQETGEAGQMFSRKCAARLLELGVEDVKIVDMGESDDPSSLYKEEPARFKDRFSSLLRSAQTLQQIEAREMFKPASAAVVSSVSWLHQGYVPVGYLTLLAGLPGTGKTTVAASYAASVSSGQPMPQDTRALDPGQVLFMSREDGEGQLRGRLEAAGCYLDNVQMLVEGSKMMMDAEGVRKLRSACEVIKPKLVIIDPIVDYMSEDADMNHAQDVRALLKPLMAMAQDFQLSIMMLAHNSKRIVVGDVQDVVAGSRDWTASARSVMTLYPDPARDNGSVLAQVKTNLGKPSKPLRFQLVDELTTAGTIARAQWSGPSPLSAEEIQQMMAVPQARQALAEAREFISDLLSRGSMDRAKVTKACRANGIRIDAMKSAIRVLAIEQTGTMLSMPYSDDMFDGEEIPV